MTRTQGRNPVFRGGSGTGQAVRPTVARRALRTALRTVDEAAADLGIRPQTVRAQLRSGDLAGIRVGRFWLVEPAAIEAYRAEHLGRTGRREKAAS